MMIKVKTDQSVSFLPSFDSFVNEMELTISLNERTTYPYAARSFVLAATAAAASTFAAVVAVVGNDRVEHDNHLLSIWRIGSDLLK